MRTLIAVAFMALMAAACQNAGEPTDYKADNMELNGVADTAFAAPSPEDIPDSIAPVEQQSPAPENGNSSRSQNARADEIAAPPPVPTAQLVKKASLEVEVKSLKSYRQQLSATLQSAGAYVEREGLTKDADSYRCDLTVKVPATSFEAVLQAMEAGAGAVLSKTQSAEEVSQQIFDARARAESQAILRRRYLSIVPKVKSAEDLVELQREIHQTTTEMEMARARAAELRAATLYSTINLNISAPASLAPTADKPGFGTQLVAATGRGVEVMQGVLLVLATIWPVLLLAAIAWWIFRLRPQRKLTAAKQTTDGK